MNTRANSDQHEFDFLMPYGPSRALLNPREAARCLDRTEEFVYGLISEGKLEALAPTDREKRRYKITRRSVLAVLAEQALFEPENYLQRVLAVLRTLNTRADIQAALHQLSQQLNKAA
jgi:hypothetical protein